ncbi:hypothetical protein FOA52_011158 [Chlamydomonas sp. UWO 241]|nr:hypothetical protein FOA52_011158 [Chlamydomonas sp. UWO 241]
MSLSMKSKCVAATRSTRSALPVRGALRVSAAKQSPMEAAKKVAVAVTSTIPAMMVASPAWALVDERMNGDGTGLPFGINNGALGLAMVGVFGLVWSQWYAAQRDLGDFKDADDGLKID